MNGIIHDDIMKLIENCDIEQFREKKVYITGATGNIASYLVHFFMTLSLEYTLKCDVTILARKKDKAERFFERYLKSDYFHIIIGKAEDTLKFKYEIDYCFCAAGSASSALFSTRPADVLTANVIGVYQVLEAVKFQKNKPKIVFFSSGAVYGNEKIDSEVDLENEVYFRADPLADDICYIEGKRTGEALCRAYCKQYAIPISIARIGHAYGPAMDISDGHIYADIVKAIVEKNDLILKNPLVKRPFTYVADTVLGILFIALYGEKMKAYNVMNEEGMIEIGKIATDLFSRYNKEGMQVLFNGQKYVFQDDGLIDQKELPVVTAELRQLGWAPRYGYMEGFCRTIESFTKT